MKDLIKRRKSGAVTENILVFFVGIIVCSALIVMLFGTFSSVNDKWAMRQTAREYMLKMETLGYLSEDDKNQMLSELGSYGLTDISLDGTTMDVSPNYGQKIYLSIEGTYEDKILAFSGAISKFGTHKTKVKIYHVTTSKG